MRIKRNGFFVTQLHHAHFVPVLVLEDLHGVDPLPRVDVRGEKDLARDRIVEVLADVLVRRVERLKLVVESEKLVRDRATIHIDDLLDDIVRQQHHVLLEQT